MQSARKFNQDPRQHYENYKKIWFKRNRIKLQNSKFSARILCKISKLTAKTRSKTMKRIFLFRRCSSWRTENWIKEKIDRSVRDLRFTKPDSWRKSSEQRKNRAEYYNLCSETMLWKTDYCVLVCKMLNSAPPSKFSRDELSYMSRKKVDSFKRLPPGLHSNEIVGKRQCFLIFLWRRKHFIFN